MRIRDSDREKARRDKKNYDLKKNYGITLIDYEDQLEYQDNKCAVCGVDECSSGRLFAVDHDHETGNLRGLLCSNCNQALGKFHDDIETMIKAIEYLENRGVWHG